MDHGFDGLQRSRQELAQRDLVGLASGLHDGPQRDQIGD
jgi:hypothetical protein